MCGKFMPVLSNKEKYIANPTPPIDDIYITPTIEILMQLLCAGRLWLSVSMVGFQFCLFFVFLLQIR